jgi:hypothetical protein
MKGKRPQVKKPVLNADLAMTFAEEQQQVTPKKVATSKENMVGEKRSGKIPAGDVRLTVNVREDLHLRLKVEAAHRRTTIGEILEELIEAHVGRNQ